MLAAETIAEIISFQLDVYTNSQEEGGRMKEAVPEGDKRSGMTDPGMDQENAGSSW